MHQDVLGDVRLYRMEYAAGFLLYDHRNHCCFHFAWNESQTLDGKMSMPLMVMLVLIYGVAIYVGVIFLIRRLHDRNHNGWLSLLIFVPVVNLVFTLYLLLAPGHRRK